VGAFMGGSQGWKPEALMRDAFPAMGPF
jgi:hypothetical protein